MQGFLYLKLRGGHDNEYAHPLDLTPIVDLNTREVVHMDAYDRCGRGRGRGEGEGGVELDAAGDVCGARCAPSPRLQLLLVAEAHVMGRWSPSRQPMPPRVCGLVRATMRYACRHRHAC